MYSKIYSKRSASTWGKNMRKKIRTWRIASHRIPEIISPSNGSRLESRSLGQFHRKKIARCWINSSVPLKRSVDLGWRHVAEQWLSLCQRPHFHANPVAWSDSRHLSSFLQGFSLSLSFFLSDSLFLSLLFIVLSFFFFSLKKNRNVITRNQKS